MWSILSGRGLTQPIEYGVTPPGFTTMVQPQKLIAGRVYAGFATDGHGGLIWRDFRIRIKTGR